MCLTIFFAIFGLLTLVKGEFKITNSRRIGGSLGRVLGILLLISAGLSFAFGDQGGVWAVEIAILVVVIGLVGSERIPAPVGSENVPLAWRPPLALVLVVLLALALCFASVVAPRLL